MASLWAAPALAQQSVLAESGSARVRVLVAVVSEDLLDNLAKLAARAKRETVRCLVGLVQGDTVYVETALEPPIHTSSPSRVKYAGCPRGTFAKWHNHLARFAATPADACYLSDTDVADALIPGAPPLQVVQVNETVMCWWTQRQIASARPGAFLMPDPRQSVPPGGVPTRR